MAIIYPEGLFNGKRLRACSDTARLYWPYLFLHANGFGRFEVDYDDIARTVFVGFKNFPKVSEFSGILQEFHENGLLFLYEAEDGRVWGQWDCKLGSLPRYQTAKDRKSPAPPVEAFEAWKKSTTLKNQQFPKLAENFGKFQLGIGIGIGVGVGEKHTPASASAERITAKAALKAKQQVWFDQWWPTVWRKVDRKDAFEKFCKFITDEKIFAEVIAATKIQGPRYSERDIDKQPHPSTWLNRRRWEDDPAAYQPSQLSLNGYRKPAEEPTTLFVPKPRRVEDDDDDEPFDMEAMFRSGAQQ